MRIQDDQAKKIRQERTDLNRLLEHSKAKAEAAGIDIRPDVRTIQRRMEAIDRKLADAPDVQAA